MEIILKQDILNLGHTDDIVEVKNGYGRNHLIPKGMAILADSSAKKVLAENKRQRAHKEAKLIEEATKIAEQIKGKEIKIGAKTSSTGKIFGSVNTIQIAEALAKKGFDIDRKKIAIPGNAIKEIGTYKANIGLHREVNVEIEFEVFSE
ncbi:MAG: 50S ribosomal protein L9 [Salinivirgaceae bacterium]|jgi:large subunit ribosomal protein L9|nr:50S ribosomal protein L9 [Salinivirgaceae bacterium]